MLSHCASEHLLLNLMYFTLCREQLSRRAPTHIGSQSPHQLPTLFTLALFHTCGGDTREVRCCQHFLRLCPPHLRAG